MKQKDIALVIFIAAISAVLSLGVSKLIFTTPQNRQQSVAVVDPITSEFNTPDNKYFNNQSIDPAELIEVGSSNNPNPFNGSGH